MRLLPIIFFALAAHVCGQQASSFTYGFGCGHSERPFEATLTYTGVPRLGSAVTVNYQSPTAPGYQIRTVGFLYTGVSRETWVAYQLPVWAPRIGAPVALHAR